MIEAMIGPVTPDEIVPVKAGTRSTSTRYFAASTPTVGWPWSSRRMNCTWQPLMPPPWLMCSTASCALSAIFLVIGPMDPVSGSTPPIFTGQLTWAAASVGASMTEKAMAAVIAIHLFIGFESPCWQAAL